VYAPFKALLPIVEPNDIVLGGWDISGLNMAEAMERAAVLDFELQKQLVPYMKDIVPLPGGWVGGGVGWGLLVSLQVVGVVVVGQLTTI